jgi:hypothetical protein
VVPGTPAFLANLRVYGTIILASLALVVMVGVKYVNRFGAVCLVAVLAAIASVFIGVFATPFDAQPFVCQAGRGLMQSDDAGNCTAECVIFPFFLLVSLFANRDDDPIH